MDYAPTFLASILAFELFLAGQARITSRLTPTLHDRIMARAAESAEALSFIPIHNPENHSRFIGCAMCVAGVLMLFPQTRDRSGAMVTLALTSAGFYAQRRMGVSYKLPVINSVMTLAVVFLDHLAQKT